MKKYLSILLAALVLLSICIVISACSNNDVTSNVEASSKTEVYSSSEVKNSESSIYNETSSTNSAEISLPSALVNLARVTIKNLPHTTWAFSGGTINKEPMTKEEVNILLGAAGQKIDFVFNDSKNIQRITGFETLNGTYELLEDNTVIHIVFTDFEYYGVIIKDNSDLVLVLCDSIQQGSTLHLLQKSK